MADSPKLPQKDPIVEKLKKAGGRRVIIGLVGDGSSEGTLRIHLTADLENFVEVSEADVIHSERLPKRLSMAGGSVVWVKKDAEVKVHTSEHKKAQAAFLSGMLAGAGLARSGSSHRPSGRIPVRLPDQMGITWYGCTSDPEYCPFSFRGWYLRGRLGISWWGCTEDSDYCPWLMRPGISQLGCTESPDYCLDE